MSAILSAFSTEPGQGWPLPLSSFPSFPPGTLKVLKKFLQSVKRGGKARSLTNFLKGSNFNLSDDDSSDGEDDHARKNIRGVQKRGLTRGMTHKNTKFGIIK